MSDKTSPEQGGSLAHSVDRRGQRSTKRAAKKSAKYARKQAKRQGKTEQKTTRKTQTRTSKAKQGKQRGIFARSVRKLKKLDKSAEDIHISPIALFTVWQIYRQAVGKFRYVTIAHKVVRSVVGSVVVPLLAGLSFDYLASAVTTHDFLPFIIVVLLMLGIELAMTAINECYGYLANRSNHRVFAYATEKVARKYIRIPLSEREGADFANRVERVRSFAGSIGYISSNMIEIFASLLSIVLALFSTFTVSPLIFIVVAVSSLPYSVLSWRLSKRRLENYRHYSKDRRIAWAIEQQLISDTHSLEVELNGLSDVFVDRMVETRRRTEQKDLDDEREFMGPTITFRSIESFASYLTLGVVGCGIIIGRLEIGSFATIRELQKQLRSNIGQLFGNLASSRVDLAKATDFVEYLNLPEQVSGDIKVTELPTIEFRDVTFTYPEASRPALSNITVKLEPGQSLALVGANGAGKTTFVKLLIGSYKPDSGLILVNGYPIERIDRESYLDQIGAIFQDFSRYDFATLGENVWFGDISRKYNETDIMRALECVGLGDLPSQYKRGLNQILSKNFTEDDPTSLSGGQWQRLCIARAFYRSPNLLILDEATSAVDAESEYDIFRNILDNQKGKSTLVISHRFSTVRYAQKIVVLEDGRVVEQGTHDTLMRRRGLYARMFNKQAAGYN